MYTNGNSQKKQKFKKAAPQLSTYTNKLPSQTLRDNNGFFNSQNRKHNLPSLRFENYSLLEKEIRRAFTKSQVEEQMTASDNWIRKNYSSRSNYQQNLSIGSNTTKKRNIKSKFDSSQHRRGKSQLSKYGDKYISDSQRLNSSHYDNKLKMLNQ